MLQELPQAQFDLAVPLFAVPHMALVARAVACGNTPGRFWADDPVCPRRRPALGHSAITCTWRAMPRRPAQRQSAISCTARSCRACSLSDAAGTRRTPPAMRFWDCGEKSCQLRPSGVFFC